MEQIESSRRFSFRELEFRREPERRNQDGMPVRGSLRFPLQENGRERRERETERLRTALCGLVRSLLTAKITHVRTAVVGRVGIKDFLVKTGLWRANPVAFTDYRSAVENNQEQVLGLLPVAGKREHAVIGVIGVQPLETLPIEIDLMQSRLAGEQFIQIAH